MVTNCQLQRMKTRTGIMIDQVLKLLFKLFTHDFNPEAWQEFLYERLMH